MKNENSKKFMMVKKATEGVKKESGDGIYVKEDWIASIIMVYKLWIVSIVAKLFRTPEIVVLGSKCSLQYVSGIS